MLVKGSQDKLTLDFGWTLNSVTGELPRRKAIKTQREDGHMKMEAEIGAVLPQAKEHLEPLEDGGDTGRLLVRALRERVALVTP